MIHNPDNRSCDTVWKFKESHLQRGDFSVNPSRLNFFGSSDQSRTAKNYALNAIETREIRRLNNIEIV